MRRTLILSVYLLLAFQQSAHAQQLSICNWYEDKKAAVVMTFDDWLISHEKIVAPKLIENNLVGTYFITANNTKYRKESFSIIRMANRGGSEITNHTVSHPDLTQIPFHEVQREIYNTEQLILDSVPNAIVNTFAYPMGTKNPQIIKELQRKYIGARGVSQESESNVLYDFNLQEEDYFDIKTVRMWRIVSTSKFKSWLVNAEKGGGLLTFMFHSIFNDSIPAEWDAISEQKFDEFLNALKAKRKTLWITTLQKAIAYHKCRKNITLTNVVEGQESVSFDRTKRSKDVIPNVVLTLKLNEVSSIHLKGFKKVFLNGNLVRALVVAGEIRINVPRKFLTYNNKLLFE